MWTDLMMSVFILIRILQSPSLYSGSFRMTNVVEFRMTSVAHLWRKDSS